MAAENSVTHWFGLLRAGDSVAAQRLWERYFPQLVRLARMRLLHSSRIADDPEDFALSAFASFCRNAEQGKFPQLEDRNDLWRLLVTLTLRKIIHAVRDQSRLKRGSAVTDQKIDLNEIMSNEPTPEFANQVTEEFRQLLDLLADAELANIAVWKMEGYTNAEIGARIGRSPRTIERKLWLIRRIWQQGAVHDDK